jgi:enoyl-CoA hydratase/carnithine racemase
MTAHPDISQGDSSPPIWQVQHGVGTLTLNRPAHRNRLHDEDLRVILQTCDAVRADPSVRALILTARTGPGMPVFSAGYHIGEFGHNGAAPMPFEHVPDALAALPVLTICALNGSVFGGATDLALACDFRVGVQGMTLRMPAAALGLHYYPSGMRRYVARLGLGAARRLFLLADTVSDQDLLAMGYLDKLVAPQDLMPTALAMAEQAASLAPLALQGMKQTLNEMAIQANAPHDPLMMLWRHREAQTQTSADFAEGRQAFAEKRRAVFRGQ